MTDIVGIYSQQTGEQRFANAHGMKLQIARQSKVMSHPVESGTSASDFRVVLPVEAQLLVMLTGAEYKNLYQQFDSSFILGELLVLQGRTKTFRNMIISAMPHEESADMMASAQMILTLTEVQFFATQYTAALPRTSNSRSRATTRRGEQSPENKDSVAYKALFGK